MRKLSFLVVAVAAAVACSDAFKPTTENVSGHYVVDYFRTDSGGVHKDWVAAGAQLELLLSPLGDVVGHLSIPMDTTTFLADMFGTWTLSGKTVHFTQDADSFVRDMDWLAADKNLLSADKTFGDVRVRVVLIRLPGPALP